MPWFARTVNQVLKIYSELKPACETPKTRGHFFHSGSLDCSDPILHVYMAEYENVIMKSVIFILENC